MLASVDVLDVNRKEGRRQPSLQWSEKIMPYIVILMFKMNITGKKEKIIARVL